ncbi:hypothetical protein D8827_00040 [Streptococcus intermedius]|uniref:Uncharacterized protein n=1 Tax=Streptococcus intermedius TaxID=1338 RepID=A0AAE8G0U7_STRIT|nr:hypothetical protein [Streptococcus intermedius]PMR92918.1 hypothetical protein C1M49_02340 [Streptococcus intermedius]RSJ24159.1 hypothetical protein D8827_00040 [Streptococcus intermedius]
MKSIFKDINCGAVYARGVYAEIINDFKKQLDKLLIFEGFEPLWLPSLIKTQVFHPQNVDSSHRDGFLVHAACLPFFEHELEFTNGKYFGVNRVHRLEPLRTADSETRLECFEVFEVIITGDEEFVDVTYESTKDLLQSFIENFLGVSSDWYEAGDSFIDDNIKKEELKLHTDDMEFAIMSGNKHGTFFTKKSNKVSCCFGIGIERILKAKKELDKRL